MSDIPSEYYERRTVLAVVAPAPGARDLHDPITGCIVVPRVVELELTRVETPDSDREYAHVSVHGPRRLKSGQEGKGIDSLGWEAASQTGPHGYVFRPDWLTGLLAEHLPEGWHRSLLNLTTTTPEEGTP